MVERRTARGNIAVDGKLIVLQEPVRARRPRARPSPDKFDRLANRYQAELVKRYETWANKTRTIVTGAIARGATVEQARTIVDNRMDDLLVELRQLGRQRIQDAADQGLGRTFEDLANDPAILARIASLQTQNDTLLADTLIPSLKKRLGDGIPEVFGSPDTAFQLAALTRLLLAGRSAIAPFSGGVVHATFDVQTAAGRIDNIAREARGELIPRVRWVLDTAAEHCVDDPRRGTLGCPGLARVYEAGWGELPTVPAGNVSCLGNCRCRLEVDMGRGWERLR